MIKSIKKKIAIFGSNSEIARDLILNIHSKYDLLLFTHRKTKLKKWLKANSLQKCKAYSFKSLNSKIDLKCIINFIGSGDPIKTSKLKKNFVLMNDKYDKYCIEHIKNFPNVKYIYLMVVNYA